MGGGGLPNDQHTVEMSDEKEEVHFVSQLFS